MIKLLIMPVSHRGRTQENRSAIQMETDINMLRSLDFWWLLFLQSQKLSSHFRIFGQVLRDSGQSLQGPQKKKSWLFAPLSPTLRSLRVASLSLPTSGTLWCRLGWDSWVNCDVAKVTMQASWRSGGSILFFQIRIHHSITIPHGLSGSDRELLPQLYLFLLPNLTNPFLLTPGNAISEISIRGSWKSNVLHHQ